MTNRPKSAAGFTLVELLVALVLLSMASLLIVEGLRFGLRTWDAVNLRLTRAEAVATAQQVLRQRLHQIVPLPPDRAGDGAFALLGDAQELRFVAPGPHSLSGRILRYRLFLDRADGGTLKISWAPDAAADERMQADPQNSESLLDNVSDLQLDYFSRSGREPGSWLPSWTRAAEAPLLVRLRLHFTNGAAGDWPALIVRPLLDMPADCRFDLVSRRCR